MLTQLTPHPCKTGNAVGMPCNETISKPKMSFVVVATILKWKKVKYFSWVTKFPALKFGHMMPPLTLFWQLSHFELGSIKLDLSYSF